MPSCPPSGRGPASTAEAPAADQPRRPTDTASTADQSGPCSPTSPTGPAITQQPSTATTDTPGSTGPDQPVPTFTASPAVTDQPRIPASTTWLTRRTRSAIPAVAKQQPARPTGSPRPVGPVSAIADQRAPQQRLGGGIYHAQQILQRRSTGGLGNYV